MTYNDPQEVHGGECIRCGNWFADNEEDLDANDRCDDCAEEVAAEIAEEEGDAEPEEPLTLAPRTDWLGLAADITGASQ